MNSDDEPNESTTDQGTCQSEPTSDKTERKRKKEEQCTEDELERLAVEMILSEAKRNKTRADEHGATGWTSHGRPKANKRFAKRVITLTVMRNKLSNKK